MNGWHRNVYPLPRKNNLWGGWRHDDGRVIWQGRPDPSSSFFVYRVEWPDGKLCEFSRLSDAKNGAAPRVEPGGVQESPTSSPSAALVDREALRQFITKWRKFADTQGAIYANGIHDCVNNLEALLSPRTDTPTGEPNP